MVGAVVVSVDLGLITVGTMTSDEGMETLTKIAVSGLAETSVCLATGNQQQQPTLGGGGDL